MKSILIKVIGIAFILVLVITSVDLVSFDRSFYEAEYRKLRIADDIDIAFTDLLAATDVLLDYTQGEREDLDVKLMIAGKKQEVFNIKEKTHMKDVAKLYHNAILVRNICLVVVIFGVIGTLIFRIDYKEILSSYNKISLLFVFFIGFLIMIAVVDFNWFWTNFHRVFFTNELWLLDPKTDILIKMVPERFFFDLVIRIITCFMFMFVSSNGVAYYFYRKRLKRKI
ncbi:MAG: TIGR01906 family membrane protein [Erysipelotrichaceae bacterium]|nr:TIGR01906 family membrane protein [Erysipelotrichaceae bacterium]